VRCRPRRARLALHVREQHQDLGAADPAELWLERREELGFPLGQAPALAEPPPPPPPLAPPQGGADAATADLIMEIGCEELPPADANAAVAQLRSAIGLGVQ